MSSLRRATYALACALFVTAAGCASSSSAVPSVSVAPAPSETAAPAIARSSGPRPTVVGPSDRIDVAYASVSTAERLDVHLPPIGAGPFPVVVWIHGGGWDRGDRGLSAAGPQQGLLGAGYAVVSVDYRLSAEAVFPAQIDDIKAAIRFVRAHTADFNLDTTRIGVWGDSAGGQLAALAGTSGDIAAFDDVALGNIDRSSRVQAVVDWYGPSSFSTMDEQFATDGCAKRVAPLSSVESRLLGASVATRGDLAAAASPVTYVSTDDPPFFIEHGKADCMVPWQQSDELATQLRSSIGEAHVSLTLLDNAGHGGAAFTAKPNVALVVAFFDAHLR